jgi:hypothetical protein
MRSSAPSWRFSAATSRRSTAWRSAAISAARSPPRRPGHGRPRHDPALSAPGRRGPSGDGWRLVAGGLVEGQVLDVLGALRDPVACLRRPVAPLRLYVTLQRLGEQLVDVEVHRDVRCFPRRHRGIPGVGCPVPQVRDVVAHVRRGIAYVCMAIPLRHTRGYPPDNCA